MAMLVLFLFGLNVALQRRYADKSFLHNGTLTTGILLVLWLGVLVFLSHLKLFDNWDEVPPRFLFVLIPPMAIVFLATFSSRVKRLLLTIPAQWLVYIQTFRIAVEIVLWLIFLDYLIPVQMTFEGLNFDVLIGITALPAGYWIMTKRATPAFIIAWNVLGLLLLTNIVFIAIFSTPSPLNLFPDPPYNTIITQAPFVWLPGFLVPLAMFMHLLSVKKTILERDSF
jgi:hypothetical protein